MNEDLYVSGVVRDPATGAGLPDVRVEAWSVASGGHAPLVAAVSDATGGFRLGLPPVVGRAELFAVEFRVSRRGRVLWSETRELVGGGGLEVVDLSGPTSATSLEDEPSEEERVEGGRVADEPIEDEPTEPGVVEAQVVGALEDDAVEATTVEALEAGSAAVHGELTGVVPAGARVQAVVRTLDHGAVHERAVGEVKVDDDGDYRLIYRRPSHGEMERSSLVVKLLDSDGAAVMESAPLLHPEGLARLDLHTSSIESVPELQRLRSAVQEELPEGVSALHGLDDDTLDEVAGWLDIEEDHLMLLVRTEELEAATGAPASLMYALGRAGLPTELEALVDVPTHELRATLEGSIADGVIEPTREVTDESLARLTNAVADRVIGQDGPTMGWGFGEALACADLPREQIRDLLRAYQARDGSLVEFWDSVAGDEPIRLALELSSLVGLDPPLLRRLHAARRAGEWTGLEDLARWSFDHWCELVEAADAERSDDEDAALAHVFEDEGGEEEEAEEEETEEEEAEEDEAEEDEAEEEEENGEQGHEGDDLEDFEDFEDEDDWVEERVNGIFENLEEAFPSAFITTEAIEAEAVGPAAAELLRRAPNHDVLQDSIRTRIEAEPELIEVFASPEAAEAAIDEIEAVERVSRVTTYPEEVTMLVGTGMTSAHAIATTPRRHFIETYGEALGGRPQAARIHAQAQNTAAGSLAAMVRLLQAFQDNPQALKGPAPVPAAAQAKILKDVPDARTLFGSVGFCACEHCGSVYSPAAYLVDLLRYLHLRDPDRLRDVRKALARRNYSSARIREMTRRSPLEALLRRRPDLGELPLTCKNTLTPLPYIDLVNELLEAQVVGGNAAHDTGSTPADVLKAAPQFTNPAAYEQLRVAVHPITLPFHEPLEVTRAYLGHLGVPRRKLMETFATSNQSASARLAETMGISPEELAIIVGRASEPWRHLGLGTPQIGATPYLTALARVPTFLELTGLTFQGLIDLVASRFVNADDAMKLETSAPDCDPEKVRIVGLDASRLWKLLTLHRVVRCFGWSTADVDRALAAIQTTTLDAASLAKLVAIRDVAKALGRKVDEVLGLWATLDTWGEDNRFDRLFRTRAVAWKTGDAEAFTLRADRRELARTGPSLDPVAPALSAAFRVTDDELTVIRRIGAALGTAPVLDLAGLSMVYRVALLARTLRLSIERLGGLLRLVEPEAQPFRPGDPAATLRFIEITRLVEGSDFSVDQLSYLFRPPVGARRDPGPRPAQIDSVLGSLQRALAGAFTETAMPREPNGDALRSKLAMQLDVALLDQAMQALDPRSPMKDADRRRFFERHLARLFDDGAAAARRLFDDGSPALSAAPATRSPEALEYESADGDDSDSEQLGDTWLEAEAAASSDPQVALARRWQARIRFVFEQVLPRLRRTKMRGAVVQTLGDTLGLSSASTARLIDGVLESRRDKGAPLIRDFHALLGTGLTGAYFSNPDLRGEPVATRTDENLALTWSGGPPAPGVPGRNFSVRWSGRLLAKSKGEHTFFVKSDGAVKLTLTVGDTPRVLLDANSPGGGRAVEHTSTAVALEQGTLYALTLEYRNRGGAASISVAHGTSPTAKGPIPTARLFPMDGGLASLEVVRTSYRRLHRAAMLITGFSMTDAQVQWLTGRPAVVGLNELPTEPPPGAAAIQWFQRWRQLASLFALRRRLPQSDVDPLSASWASTTAESLDRLAKCTGWDRNVLAAMVNALGLGEQGLRFPTDPTATPGLVRLERAMESHRRTGVAVATLVRWATANPDVDMAAEVVQAVKSRYDEKRWLEVAQQLNDPLRKRRRDALVAYLLPRLRERGVKTRSQLFEYFLIDVEMDPCMLTSRIKQAISAVQTFFQRSLMNLEPQVQPRLIDARDWKWLKNYRVWEANRKVFLYPENWIEPELRRDKSPIFLGLEQAILQKEIKKDNVEAAFLDYLQRLDEVARLDVRGVWFEPRRGDELTEVKRRQRVRNRPGWEAGTYHIFARTFSEPYLWFYRRLERGRHWTAWEKIDTDIEGDHLVPVLYQRRMHLFWTIFREASKKTPPMNKEAQPYTLGKDWEISVAYSVYDRGKWSRKQVSQGAVVDVLGIPIIPRPNRKKKNKRGPRLEGSAWLNPRNYTLRAIAGDGDGGKAPGKVQIFVYRRAFSRIHTVTVSEPSTPDALLSHNSADAVGWFQLDGCSGNIRPVRAPSFAGRVVVQAAGPRRRRARKRGFWARLGRGFKKERKRPRSSRLRSVRPFNHQRGGRLNVPPGFIIDGVGYVARGRARTLSQPGHDGGNQVVLRIRKAARTRMLPVYEPNAREERKLRPFFLQDQWRTYFARPVEVAFGERTKTIRIRPRVWRFTPRFGRRRGRGARKRRARTTRRREDVELALAEDGMAPLEELEAIELAEDDEDEAWHPDDAAERRKRRRRKRRRRRVRRRGKRRVTKPRRTKAPARRTTPKTRVIKVPARHELRLRFTPFEHPATCRLIRVLKEYGIDGLLQLSTTRPPRHRDPHGDSQYVNGRWVTNASTQFTQHYKPGALADRESPTRDIDFDDDNPYAVYNWELFFHAPLQVAIRLAKDGRHEEAQRWFHYVFDPTSDTSVPAPRRYWRFAPFHENTEYAGARELMALLSTRSTDPDVQRRQRAVRAQVTEWMEHPFDPHVIAKMRTVAYQKAVVMKYIDNLIEWGDKLFRRDTMESIQEATQLYILAGNILGARPERIEPLVRNAPATFSQVRSKLDLFANWLVRFENSQVRRPFRVNARPQQAGVTSLLGMATQYFCVPPNPQMAKYWDTVADRLYKIRHCMNIKGKVRQLALFEPPIDPGMLVRAAAAGADLGSVIADLNAPPPHQRFRVLIAHAHRLAEDLRRFGTAMLSVLEKRDAEELAAVRASNETVLLKAQADVRKLGVRQIEEEVAAHGRHLEMIDMQAQRLLAELQQLMNAQEESQQQSLSAAQVIAGVAEGVDLVAKVLYAIPDFQAGAAGGFSSPFTTVQLGGQMLGDITSAVAESLGRQMVNFSTQAQMAERQAEFQRRKEEYAHQLEVLHKQREEVVSQVAAINLRLEIKQAELKRHETAVENANHVETYLKSKYTNEQLYGWMLGQLSGTYFQAYKFAFDAARLAERAFRFERGDSSAQYIQFSYWDSLRKGLHSGERLTLDLRRLEAAYLAGDERALAVTRHISLRTDFPTALQQLVATGRCRIEVGETLLDGDFPGHYFRRIKAAKLSVIGPTAPYTNVNCTLTLLSNRIRKDANASGSYPQAEEGDDPRFLIDFAPTSAVATSLPNADAGVFELRFDGDNYLPFEGAGAISTWALDLHQANNAFDLSKVDDVVLTLQYTARSGGAPLEAAARANRGKRLARGGLVPAPQHRVSLRKDAPEIWKQLASAAGKPITAPLDLGHSALSGRYRGMDVRFTRMHAYAHGRRRMRDGAVSLQLAPPKGQPVTVAGWTRPWPRTHVMRAATDVAGRPGKWTLTVGVQGETAVDLFDDIVLVFEARVKPG